MDPNSQGGKRGRGAAGKTPFVAAVETSLDRKPKRLTLQVVKGFRKAEITRLARSSFAAGTNVVSDGLSCWRGRVDTTLGNIETALAGTCHHVRAKHAQRFNRRFQRDTQTERLVWAALHAKLRADRIVIAG